MSGISEVSSFYYGNKVFIVYLRSLFCTGALVARAAKLRRDSALSLSFGDGRRHSSQAPETKAHS